MMYAGQPSPPMTATAIPTLATSTTALHEQLEGIADRLMKLGDHLFGSEPREVGKGDNQPEPVPSVRRNLDKASHALRRIEEALSRLEAQS